MRFSRKKIFLVGLLLLTSLFQGWPLLVAAQCRMFAAAQACEIKSSCCCAEQDQLRDLSYSKCRTGKKLAGVLSTDPSALSAVEKTGKSPLVAQGGAVIFPIHSKDAAPGTCSFAAAHTQIPQQLLPAVFLLDCVFRI